MRKIEKDTKIIKWIVLLPIIAVLLTSFLLTNLFINSKLNSYEKDIKRLEQNHISHIKGKIKSRVLNISNLLDNTYKNQIDEAKNNIKNFIYLGYSILSTIYEENKSKPKEEIFKIINERMKNIRFFENNSGYFFIYDLDSAISISLPSSPSFVGKSVRNLTDKNGKNLYDSYAKIIKKNNEGFDTWLWNKPNSDKKTEKLGFIKRFEPLNIVIGTAVYMDDIKKYTGKEVIQTVENLKFEDDSYIFISDMKGTSLSHKSKSIINLPLEELSKKVQNTVRAILEKIKTENEGFIEYIQDEKLFEGFIPSKKISYVKHNKTLNWIIGNGLYTNDLNKEIKIKRDQLEEKLYDDIELIIIISFIVSVVIIILLLLLSKKIKQTLLFYSNSLEEKNLELEQLNLNLEKKVNNQVDEMRKKDLILNQQSKLAALGEVLGNIAHQWRQPLSAISTLASGIRIQKELGLIDDKKLDDDLVNIVSTTKMLSNTIDDFRNFYSVEKEKSDFEVETVIKQAIGLVMANLKNLDINIIEKIEKTKIHSYPNELIQVILNLINNSKDVLKDKKDKYIFINSFSNSKDIVIEILDNGDGIKDDILTRVFEPYFTTKFKSQGTGIGLYMSKNIVENSLNGSIEVENYVYEYENKKFKGAKFILKLPKVK